MPESGRNVATKIGASYYETSVFNHFGIELLFTNALRAALAYKRSRHFWLALSNLKNVRGLEWQAPHCVPAPSAPVFPEVPIDDYVDLSSAINCPEFSDVIFDIGGVSINAHSACLAAGSQVLFDLLNIACLGKSAGVSIRSSDVVLAADLPMELSSAIQRSIDGSVNVVRLDHDVFRFVLRHNCSADGSSLPPAVVVVDSSVSIAAFTVLLHFVYTGTLQSNLSHEVCCDVRHLAGLLAMDDLAFIVANYCSAEDVGMSQKYRQLVDDRRERVRKLLLCDGSFAGNNSAHNLR